MLEHVGQDDREAAVIELLRVLRPGGLLIATFPSGSRSATADRLVNVAWTRRFGEPNPWLLEHQELGLPSLEVIESAVSRAGCGSLAVTRNAAIPAWLAMHQLQILGISAYRLDRLVAWGVRHWPPVPAYRLVVEVNK